MPGLTLEEVRRSAAETDQRLVTYLHGNGAPQSGCKATPASPIASGSTPMGTTRSTPRTSVTGGNAAPPHDAGGILAISMLGGGSRA
jgi:hypothetical protein